MNKLNSYIKIPTLNELFFKQTDQLLIQAFRYVFVGGISFILDWLTLLFLGQAGLHYLIGTIFAFLVGLTANYFLSKRFVFVQNPEKMSKRVEYIVYGLIGLVGLLLTEILMYLLTDILLLHYLVSKVIAAILVLGWNFIARKLILYRGVKGSV